MQCNSLIAAGVPYPLAFVKTYRRQSRGAVLVCRQLVIVHVACAWRQLVIMLADVCACTERLAPSGRYITAVLLISTQQYVVFFVLEGLGFRVAYMC